MKIEHDVNFSGASAAEHTTTVSHWTLTSRDFEDHGYIPNKHSMYSKNISPQLGWEICPSEAKSYVLTVIDAHPVAHHWVHWMVVNIPASVTSLREDASCKKMPLGAIELDNSFGKKGYGGPQPPSGTGVHTYVFTVYALDVDKVEINPGTFLPGAELLDIIRSHVVGKAILEGMFVKL